MKMISELNDHEHVEGQFLLGSVSKGVNTAGGSYFSLELRDASGTITAKKWDATLQDEEMFITGNVISIVGETNKYKDVLQDCFILTDFYGDGLNEEIVKRAKKLFTN